MISARGGGVVGPFVGGGSTVGGVVTVGGAGMVTVGGCSGVCMGAGGGVDRPLSGCGSRVSPCGLGAGSGLSYVVEGSIVTSGRGGSVGAGRPRTGGRSTDKASSSIPIMNCPSCRREARTETFFWVRGTLTTFSSWDIEEARERRIRGRGRDQSAITIYPGKPDHLMRCHASPTVSVLCQ